VTKRNVLPPTVQVLTYHLGNVVLSVHHRKQSNQAMKSEEAQPKDLEGLGHQDLREDLAQQAGLALLDLQDHNQTLLPFLDKSLSKAEKKVPHQTLFPTCRHKLVLLDREAPQVCEVHLDLKDLWVLKVTMVTLDHQVLLDRKD